MPEPTSSYAKPGDVPSQTQTDEAQPGLQHKMKPQPHSKTMPTPQTFHEDEPQMEEYRGNHKLEGKVALITGGDSGIGRAIAILYAKEGADVAIVYLEKEQKDADEIKQMVEAEGKSCLCIPMDIGYENNCKEIVNQVTSHFGHLDILVNNAAIQYIHDSIEDITSDQLEATFRTNILSMFYLVKCALPHLKKGSTIINSTSVTAYKGSPHLLDYSSTKGAIVSFTRSLALNLGPKGIRVNAVAPGPILTPLQPASREADDMKKFGEKKPPLGRIGQPVECAPSYVFLASSDSSYITGQVLHPNGGDVVNG